MKTFAKIILLIVISSNNIQSQKDFYSAKFGLTSMYLTESLGSLSASYENITNVMLGVGYEKSIIKNVAFQPELIIIGKGFQFNQNGQNAKYNLGYIELPLMLKGKFPIEKILEVYGEAGPSFSMGMGGNSTVNGQKYNDMFGKDGFNRFDFGLNYGAGINVILGNGNKILSGIRFYNGLSNIYPTNTQNVSGKNNGMIISIGYARML